MFSADGLDTGFSGRFAVRINSKIGVGSCGLQPGARGPPSTLEEGGILKAWGLGQFGGQAGPHGDTLVAGSEHRGPLLQEKIRLVFLDLT